MCRFRSNDDRGRSLVALGKALGKKDDSQVVDSSGENSAAKSGTTDAVALMVEAVSETFSIQTKIFQQKESHE